MSSAPSGTFLPPLGVPRRTLQSSSRVLQTTDQDALMSRWSAIQTGYLSDPYTVHFLTTLPGISNIRRPPLINHGTHVRTWAVDRIVEKFLSSTKEMGKDAQVVNLGAGSDTRFWRMGKGKVKRWVEVDFEGSTREKIRRVLEKDELKKGIEDVKVENEGATMYSKTLCIIPADLSKGFDLLTKLFLSPSPCSSSSEQLLSPHIPTLFIAECVFVYMSPASSQSILSWFQSTFKDSGVVGLTYEMVDRGDEFGRVMKQNLKNRQIHVPGILSEKEKQQFSRVGYKYADARDLKTIRRKDVPKSELARISTLEMLDEIEELELILEHYYLAWGVDAPAESPLLKNIHLL